MRLIACAFIIANALLAQVSSYPATNVGGLTGPIPGGRILLFSATASASATISVVTRNAAGQSGAVFQSDYDEYILEFVNLLPTTDAVIFFIEASTNGGSSYDGGANYQGSSARYISGVSTVGATGTNNIVIDGLGGVGQDSVSGIATWGITGSVHIYSPTSTSLYKQFRGEVGGFETGATSPYYAHYFAAYKSATAMNAVRVKTTSGTIASGVVRVYGVAKQ